MKKQSLSYWLLQFVASTIAGAAILFLLRFVQTSPPPQPGEYYWSTFFRNDLSWLALLLFALLAFAACYAWQWNACITGFGLISVLPIITIVESTVYRGSHNLIPFEIIVYAFYALPGFTGALLGAYLARRKFMQRQK